MPFVRIFKPEPTVSLCLNEIEAVISKVINPAIVEQFERHATLYQAFLRDGEVKISSRGYRVPVYRNPGEGLSFESYQTYSSLLRLPNASVHE